MSVQKKSLISQRSAVKAAILANPTQSVGSVPSVRPAARAASRPAARACVASGSPRCVASGSSRCVASGSPRCVTSGSPRRGSCSRSRYQVGELAEYK